MERKGEAEENEGEKEQEERGRRIGGGREIENKMKGERSSKREEEE